MKKKNTKICTFCLCPYESLYGAFAGNNRECTKTNFALFLVYFIYPPTFCVSSLLHSNFLLAKQGVKLFVHW